MAARTIITAIPAEGKHIQFDRLTKDWAMYLDGEYLGNRRTHVEAEIELDCVATERAAQLAADLRDEAAERDAEAVPDTYRYVTTLYDRITVDGQLVLTHYHIYAPINPTPHQSNAFVPVARETDRGRWSDAQDCYGVKLNQSNDTPPSVDSAEQAEPERCANCGSTAMAAPGNGRIYCLACGRPWRAAEPRTDAERGVIDILSTIDVDELSAILDTDLTALRAAVDGSLIVGALAALVSSGCYLHSRQLLISNPALPDWAAVETIARLAA